MTPMTFALTWFFANAHITPSTVAPPAISPLMPSMDWLGFRQYPPVSQVIPLPTSAVVDFVKGLP